MKLFLEFCMFLFLFLGELDDVMYVHRLDEDCFKIGLFL